MVFAYCLSAALTQEGAPDVVTQWMSSLGAGPAVVAAVFAAFALSSIIGPLPTLFVLGPLVAPAMTKLGVEPLRIAMVFGMAMSLGLLCPPAGSDLRHLGGRNDRALLAGGPRYRLSTSTLAGFVAIGLCLYGPIWQPYD